MLLRDILYISVTTKLEETMRRFRLFLLLCLTLAPCLAKGDGKPQFTVPEGALVIVSDWTLDGDTPKGFTKEVKEGVPGVALEGAFVKLTSKKASFGFKKEIKLSVKEYPYVHWSTSGKMRHRRERWERALPGQRLNTWW